MSPARLITCVLLPFAAGYYLSYLFRSINALIAHDLTAEMGLGAADLGLLTSVYFLAFAAAQLPFGILLDRHGPRTIQSVLLLLASTGALVFALAQGMVGLVIGRALIGLGVALALMAGFKAIVLWFPADRLALVNGCFVMLGALGAVTATAPAELIVLSLGWRGLFALLAASSAMAALLILLIVPDGDSSASPARAPQSISLWTIYQDPRFWRIAPLSAVGVGASWSLQGLWAAPWLKDVDGFDRATIVQHLSVMAVAVSASGLLLGLAADRLRPSGIRTESILASSLGLSMLAQLALVVGSPVPSYLAWVPIAAAGAATVLSYSILADYFPREASGRANAALNLLHVGAAFGLQSVTGLMIEQWPEAGDRYPAVAHQTAMAAGLLLQLVALTWFAMAPRRGPFSTLQLVSRLAIKRLVPPAAAPSSYSAGFSMSRERNWVAGRHAVGWRLAAAASTSVSITLLASLALASGHAHLAAHIVEVDRWSVTEGRAIGAVRTNHAAAASAATLDSLAAVCRSSDAQVTLLRFRLLTICDVYTAR